MFPTLWHKDRLFVKKVLPSEINPRDIIVYMNNGFYVSHRVRKVIEKGGGIMLYTQGDFNNSIEEINIDNLVGKVLGICRNGKTKFISYEKNNIYVIFIRIISFLKEISGQISEFICSYPCFRGIIKKLFPLRVEYLVVKNTSSSLDFNSFYNFYPFSESEYKITLGFLACFKGKPVAKLWLLKNNQDDYFIYGPYVKLIYRSRGIGRYLLKMAIEYVSSNKNRESIYAIAWAKKSILNFFKEMGFFKDAKNGFIFVLNKPYFYKTDI